MKYKRSQIKKISLKSQILRHMRKTAGLSAAKAGQRIGCSGPTIMHYENGRIEVSPQKLESLVQAYGYSMAEFRSLMATPPRNIDLKQECIGILQRLSDEKVTAIHSVLQVL